MKILRRHHYFSLSVAIMYLLPILQKTRWCLDSALHAFSVLRGVSLFCSFRMNLVSREQRERVFQPAEFSQTLLSVLLLVKRFLYFIFLPLEPQLSLF